MRKVRACKFFDLAWCLPPLVTRLESRSVSMKSCHQNKEEARVEGRAELTTILMRERHHHARIPLTPSVVSSTG